MGQRKNKQTTIDEIASTCIAVRARLLNRVISSVYDEALRPLGMTVGQLNILVVVGKRGPISPQQVGRRLHMEKSTLSRNVERIRRQGWLTSEPAAASRGQELQLTAVGRRQIDRALPLWRSAQAEAERVLGARGAKSIVAAADGVWAQSATE